MLPRIRSGIGTSRPVRRYVPALRSWFREKPGSSTDVTHPVSHETSYFTRMWLRFGQL